MEINFNNVPNLTFTQCLHINNNYTHSNTTNFVDLMKKKLNIIKKNTQITIIAIEYFNFQQDLIVHVEK